MHWVWRIPLEPELTEVRDEREDYFKKYEIIRLYRFDKREYHLWEIMYIRK